MGMLAKRGIVRTHVTYAVIATQSEAIVRDVTRTIDTPSSRRAEPHRTNRAEREASRHARKEMAYYMRWMDAEDRRYDDTVRRIDARINAEKRVNAFHPEGPSLMPGHRTIRTERRINGAVVRRHDNDGMIGNGVRWALATRN